MRKLRIILLAVLLFLGYSKEVAPAKSKEMSIEELEIRVLNFYETKRYEQEMERFIQQLGFDESRNDWTRVNTIGAMGEWQFMENTLKEIGFHGITSKKFRHDPSIFSPDMQRIALETLLSMNTARMQEYIDRYEGKTIGGVEVTKAGILAACHLGGPTKVKAFLVSNGHLNSRDAYGTSIRKYMDKYKEFDIILKTY